MEAKWLIESDILDSTEALVKSLKKYDIQFKEVNMQSRFGDDYLNIFSPGDCVVFYGSLDFAKNIRKKAKWIPGIYYNPDAFNCVQYYSAVERGVSEQLKRWGF